MLVQTIIIGVGGGSLVFLLASGFSLIWGTLGVLNVAHVSFFMLAAYILATMFPAASHGFLPFAGATIVVVLGCAILGVLLEIFVLRPLYGKDDVLTLLATFGVLIAIDGLAFLFWGAQPRGIDPPVGNEYSWSLMGIVIPKYDLGLIVVALALLAGLTAIIRYTGAGRLVRAIAEDRWYSTVAGIPTKRLSLATVAVSTALAGLAGSLAAPTLGITVSLATDYLVITFAVVIVGGVSNLYGVYLASVSLTTVDVLAGVYWPNLAGYAAYIIMFIILILRPQGFVRRRRTFLETWV